MLWGRRRSGKDGERALREEQKHEAVTELTSFQAEVTRGSAGFIGMGLEAVSWLE